MKGNETKETVYFNLGDPGYYPGDTTHKRIKRKFSFFLSISRLTDMFPDLISELLKSLKNEVVDLASDVLAREAPTAAFKLIEVMKSDKPVPQANNKLQAAQTILDRAGVVKTDKLDVNHNVSGGIFILPEKQTIDITAEDGEYETLDN